MAQMTRDLYVDDNGMSTEDVEFSSPSSAGSFVTGKACGGWVVWKSSDGKTIDTFKQED